MILCFNVGTSEEHSLLCSERRHEPAALNLLLKILKFVSSPHYVATAICLADQRRPTQRGSARLNAERTTL